MKMLSSKGESAVEWQKQRCLMTIVVGLLSAIGCYISAISRNILAGDFTWAWRGAQMLLAGQNPYQLIQATGPYPFNDKLYYPLPALIIALPFSALPGAVAGAMFFGISSGLLCWALTRTDFHRLLVFVSAPYLFSLMTVQWSPLIVAAALLSWLSPALLAKPNLGLPMLAAYRQPKSILLCLIGLGISFVIMPTWLQDWLGNLSHHLNYVPLWTWFGPLLLIALIRWRSQSAQLFFGMAVMPQRLVYDQVGLWLLPTSLRDSLLLTTLSWVGVMLGYLLEDGMWGLAGSYLAALVLVLMVKPATQTKDVAMSARN